jgi:hypothetical protein
MVKLFILPEILATVAILMYCVNASADAVDAHVDLGVAQSIGMHFGTFRLSDESI